MRDEHWRKAQNVPSESKAAVFDCRPILRVDSVDASVAYYRDSLGFLVGWRWSDSAGRFLSSIEEGPAHTALVSIGSVQIILVQRAQGQPGTWLHLDVQTSAQVDELHADWVRRGARVIEAPCNRPWGTYELRVEDLDRHTFRVASPAKRT
jgi:uncharacterized glyoxalase superfamily protein PhnB